MAQLLSESKQPKSIAPRYTIHHHVLRGLTSGNNRDTITLYLATLLWRGICKQPVGPRQHPLYAEHRHFI